LFFLPLKKTEVILMHNKPRILYTTPVLKHPAVGGPFLRIENSIKALSQISDLTIYCRTTVTRPEIEYYQQFCRNFYCAPPTKYLSRHVNRAKRMINFFSRKLVKRELLLKKEEYPDLLHLADTIHPDIIWMGFGNISYPLLEYLKKNSSYNVVCDTDSVWSRFVLRGLPFARNDTDRKRIEQEGDEKAEEERWGTQLADVTTAVSEIDAEYYRTLTKKPEQIHIFSNVIDISDYSKSPGKPATFQNPCIYLAGTFWPNSPMEESARWIIEKVMPLVKTQIPNIHCYIIGNGSDIILKDIHDPSITVTGQLPSVLSYLCHADVVVVPLKFESGTRFKILEAGACGIPVVSTTLGAEGIPVAHGINILIADDPENFAHEIIKVISNPDFAETIAENLHTLIKERYDIPALKMEGAEIIEYLMNDAK
jgi:polysaccharide biosynthesis protein PslH